MKKFTEKASFIPVFILAALPFVLLTKGVSGVVTTREPQIAVEETKKPSPYEVSYCSDNEETIDFVPEHIIIANANIDLPIVPVPLVNGTWMVNANVANYAEGTSTVNINSGNVGIFAHNRKKGFAGIQDVADGSSIEVYGGKYVATYRIEKTDISSPDSVDVFYPTEEPTITLVTCEGVFSDKRYIVKAKLVSVKQNCNETITQ